MEQVEIQRWDGIPIAQGAYRMSEQNYHADPCERISLSSTIAKIIHRTTPRHAWWQHPRLNAAFVPKPSKRHMAQGSGCHALLLGEGADIVEIEYDDYKKNAAKEERNEATADGMIPVLSKDLETARMAVEAAIPQLRENGLDALADHQGDAEIVVATAARALQRRCKLDWWSDDRLTVIDYKATQAEATEKFFVQQIPRMGYDIQDAFYTDLLGDAFPGLAGRIEFVFVVQEEKEPPFALQCFRICEADREIARRKIAEASRIWDHCLANDHWPAYPPGIKTVELGTWHTKQWLDHEMEMEEAGDSPSWMFAGQKGE